MHGFYASVRDACASGAVTLRRLGCVWFVWRTAAVTCGEEGGGGIGYHGGGGEGCPAASSAEEGSAQEDL